MNAFIMFGLAVAGGLLVWLIKYLVIKHEYPKRKAYYTGKQLMSDDEFLTFKKAAVDEDIHLSVTELNSRVPIYVDFHVTLSHAKTFPFGKRTEDSKADCLANNVLGLISIIIISVFSLCSFVSGICNLFGLLK